MRNILISGILFLAAGLAYSGHAIHAQTSQPTVVSGKVTSIYGSDIIAIGGYNGHVVLSGFGSESSDMSPADGRKALEKAIGNKKLICRHLNYDEYGRMVADCVNIDGTALLARGSIAKR